MKQELSSWRRTYPQGFVALLFESKTTIAISGYIYAHIGGSESAVQQRQVVDLHLIQIAETHQLKMSQNNIKISMSFPYNKHLVSYWLWYDILCYTN